MNKRSSFPFFQIPLQKSLIIFNASALFFISILFILLFHLYPENTPLFAFVTLGVFFIVFILLNSFFIQNLIGRYGVLEKKVQTQQTAFGELKKKNNLLEGVFYNSPSAIYLRDVEGRFIMVNFVDEQHFDYKSEEIVNKTVFDLFPEKVAQQFYKEDQLVIKNRKELIVGTDISIHGKKTHQVTTKFPLFDENGDVYAVCGISTDVSLLKNAQKAAEEANSAKSMFLANMSHEIRTPLNAILGFTEILNNELTDPKYKTYLSSILSGGKSLMSLINDILDLSKVEAGKLQLEYSAFNPFQFFKEVELFFEPKAKCNNFEFIVNISPEVPEAVVLDESRLRQVVLNLVGNAMKFTHHGKVELSVSCAANKKIPKRFDLIISVKDTGIGIPDDQRDKIFGVFEQQYGQSTSKYGGTGLGLAITKRLIELMEGRITLKSEVGKGSEFTVVLYEVQEVDPLTEGKDHFNEQLPHNLKFRPATILLADDVESNRLLELNYLAEYGFKFLEAKNGMEAVSIAQKESPDLILMDVRMPVMDGLKASTILKKDPKTSNIPIIIVTASVLNKEADEVEKIGDLFLKKPVSKWDLVRSIMHFLEYSDTRGNSTRKQKIVQPEKMEFSKEEIQNIQPVYNILKGEYYSIWKDLMDVISINDIDRFAQKIEELGKENQLPLLNEFGKELKEKTELFDMDGIRKSLNSYPVLVDTLKTLLKN